MNENPTPRALSIYLQLTSISTHEKVARGEKKVTKQLLTFFSGDGLAVGGLGGRRLGRRRPRVVVEAGGVRVLGFPGLGLWGGLHDRRL